ncbi:hypothetical protein LTR37_001027 [Vermiconidia calcicola]|uniref:Uncharacterized protein n=1 Tax=Vermiconidia calcicola TaxID=1690605 RepID=A0ACC3NWQ9_9PEZI|nr:hypothetical protein LTR37_001027 [Vermiconidia calcicola]
MSTSSRPSKTTELDKQIWQLAHLVNAATNELSACLSLNSLIQHAEKDHHHDTALLYHSALSHSRASLTTYVDSIEAERKRMPHNIARHTLDTTEQQAYTALIVAAWNTRNISGLISKVEAVVEEEGMGTSAGWPKGPELDALKVVLEDLVRNRHKGTNVMEVGWMQAWKVTDMELSTQKLAIAISTRTQVDDVGFAFSHVGLTQRSGRLYDTAAQRLPPDQAGSSVRLCSVGQPI